MTAGTKDEYTEVNWMGNTEPDMEYGPDTTSTKTKKGQTRQTCLYGMTIKKKPNENKHGPKKLFCPTVKHDIFTWKKFSWISDEKRKNYLLSRKLLSPNEGYLPKNPLKNSSREKLKIEKTQNFKAVNISCSTVCFVSSTVNYH